jgi:hypothetical protein
MSFAVVCIVALAALGLVAAVASRLQGGDDAEITTGHDCSTCLSADDGSCKLHCLMEEKARSSQTKQESE